MEACESRIGRAAGVVVENLSCIACGYNLRTMALSARCPECGRDVAESVVPAEMWLHGRGEVGWARRAIALWVLSVLLPWLGYLAFYGATVCIAFYWYELSGPGSLPGSIYRYVGRAWTYAGIAQPLFVGAAIAAFAVALARQRRAWVARSAWAVAASGGLGAIVMVSMSISFCVQLPGNPQVNPYLDVGGALLLSIAQVLWWVLLALQFRRGHRVERVIFWGALAVPVVNAVKYVLWGVIVFAGQGPQRWQGALLWTQPPPWQATLQWLIVYWNSWEAGWQLVVVVALGCYLRVLNRVCGEQKSAAALR